DKTARAVFFLQDAATKPRVRFPSCKMQRQNRACGFLPASCSDKTARAVFFVPHDDGMCLIRIS
ncbi:MAG: hypothetical protein LBT78_08685, partial [Tannerella sp.]|nr:hypothetical protein [Tannerella sp.]